MRTPTSSVPPAGSSEIEVRSLAVRDTVAVLTSLLHRAYAPLAAAGMNVTAAAQSDETTRQRALEGQCMVATLKGRIVGTITVATPLDSLSGVRNLQVPLYRENDTGHFYQFAVDPDLRGRGVGRALLQEAERWARGRGYLAMGVDAPTPATELIDFFRHQGYQQVGELHWPGKNYDSVVLRKVLDRSPLQSYVLTAARHAQWSLLRMLEAIATVADEDYRRDLGLHHGSIHATLNHLLEVEQRFWWPRIVAEESPASVANEEIEVDRQRLVQALTAARAGWIEVIEGWSDDRLLGELEFTGQNGGQIVMPLASLMAHLFDHAALHRGELVAALVRLGIEPPELGLTNMLREQPRST